VRGAKVLAHMLSPCAAWGALMGIFTRVRANL